MKTPNLILIIAIIFIGFANLYKINEEYGHFLKGEVEIKDSDILQMYMQYLEQYKSKKFDVNRDMDRFEIFKDRVRMIINHNLDTTKTWKMGISHITDLTMEEINQSYRVMEPQECSATASPRNYYDECPPSDWDWRDKDIVSPVKDQRNCGSCWTFSTTGAMESHYKLATGEEALLSEQELIDCADAETYDCHGCSGGLPSYAFNFIKDKGLETENDYPYQAKDSSCRYNATQERIITDGPFNITSGDEDQLLNELYQHGPISVAFQVVDDFVHYSSGIYSSTECKSTTQDVNHAVLAVGYGFDDQGTAYWLVKNSWSDSWGDAGYFKIERNVNMCGIAVCNSYPLNVRKA